ncbi:MAG: hypothetical protein MJ240_11790 [Kiritimatiellae bacterium]|nr:hypothetical protein [Kiritimatiellia bacterium]
MKRAPAQLLAILLLEVSVVSADTILPPHAIEFADESISFDAGGGTRMREETSHNVPGNPGGGPEVAKRVARVPGTHLLRFESQIWARADAGPYTFYGRLANRMINHFRSNGIRQAERVWQMPDEIVLDNLYLEGRSLFDGFLDYRFGRQDMAEGYKSVFGLDQVLVDPTPSDFGRSYSADMARLMLYPVDDAKLDLFGIYNANENPIAWGRQRVYKRSLNNLTPGDGPDQWGGGAIWHATAFTKDFPYKLYALYKQDQPYRRGNVKVVTKQVSTVGTQLKPNITDSLSLELEGAGQTGRRKGWGAAGGWMGVAGFDYHPELTKKAKTYVNFSAQYLSGDKDKTFGHNDTGWDPLWARYTRDGEVFARGTHAQTVYWSNMLFLRTILGAKFGPRHDVSVSSGPIWTAQEDGVGGGDGDFKGVLSRARYNFPVKLRPKNAQALERLEICGTFLVELFNPGSYYESTKPALYARWQLEFRF